MRIINAFLLLLLTSSVAFAYHRDFVYSRLCSSRYPDASYDREGDICQSSLVSSIRVRIIDPAEEKPLGIKPTVQRPFLILDGIYLSTDGKRTLSEFQKELDQIGFVETLEELGYTPVLIQFSETVGRSLEENATDFSKFLEKMNSNKSFQLKDKNDGIVVMGISQGGILGRYGAYLYDIHRSSTDAPIRLYASLDSPHQGAILPLGLYYTINFWATSGGSSSAEAFRDLIDGPGASGLLLYDYEGDYNRNYMVNTSSARFLFGKYRKAAEYKGFPSVLVAQGHLKGKIPTHQNNYFKLNRHAKKLGTILGRAESEMSSYSNGSKEISFNRRYEKWDSDNKNSKKDDAKFDFVQGSTYPFAETMYASLREGMEEAMPSHMKKGIGVFSIDIASGWDTDTLIQKNSTFIPTVSAMDMKCSGDLAIRGDCAFTQESDGFPFRKPAGRSSANAVYAVDPTHPRYNESISGRHVELPEGKNADAVLEGLHVDMWRLLCELANYDYDSKAGEFRNPNLSGVFSPSTDCMDQSRIPDVVKNSGRMYRKRLAYDSYDYETKNDGEWHYFNVPAGWHKVGLFDDGKDIPENSAFEVDIKVNGSKGNWMKAELLLLRSKNGDGQLQLQEVDIPLDGKKFVARWQLPATKELLSSYRWFRLVLNSEGASVAVANPRFVHSTASLDVPKEKIAKTIYPNSDYTLYPWSEKVSASPYSDALGTGLSVVIRNGLGMHIDFGGAKNLEQFSKLKVTYWPGTCQHTLAYFDSYRKGAFLIKNGTASGNWMSAEVPLRNVVNVDLTPKHKLSASRFVLQSPAVEEKCIIKDISLL